MPKGLRQAVKDNLAKCRAAAIAAVDAYNRPGPQFRTAHYVVLIVMAWTSAFHAIYFRRGRPPYYKRPGKKPKGDRYVRIDGDFKHWELSKCLNEYFDSNNPPERKNIEFLIGLRNKIEHRHLPLLDASLYGECQAALLNLEDLLVSEFGAEYALAEQLAVSLQFGRSIPPEKKRAAKQLATTNAKTIKAYVETFRGSLPSTTLNSTKYSFNVFLVPKVAKSASVADASVEFIKLDEKNSDDVARLEKLNVLIKEKLIPIANLDLYKPTQVVKTVQDRIPFRFTMSNHTDARDRLKVRPLAGSPKPECTDATYCVYDKVHKDYLYTEAWIKRLVKALATESGFKSVLGYDPDPK